MLPNPSAIFTASLTHHLAGTLSEGKTAFKKNIHFKRMPRYNKLFTGTQTAATEYVCINVFLFCFLQALCYVFSLHPVTHECQNRRNRTKSQVEVIISVQSIQLSIRSKLYFEVIA